MAPAWEKDAVALEIVHMVLVTEFTEFDSSLARGKPQIQTRISNCVDTIQASMC